MKNAPGVTDQKGIIAWFAANHVAANLLMLFIIVAGLISVSSIRKEMQPKFQIDWVRVTVPYLGAAPQEVEEGVVIKIEESIQDVPGIKRIIGEAFEGRGQVTAEIEVGADIDQVLNEIKIRVDSISTFPALTENPVVSKVEFRNPVILVAIYGDMDEMARKALGQQTRDDLMADPDINDVEFFGNREYEISVEVSELTLRKYGLTMTEVAQAIRDTSVDLPGGTIRTEGGDIRLRTKGQVYTGQAFADVVLRTFADGTRLTLGDVATITDGFVETKGYGRYNGKPTATLQITAGNQQNEIKTADAVKAYVEERNETLPDGITMDTWIDLSYYLKGRLQMMQDNMISGAILVFIVLSLFLRVKVAFWVIVGLPITFLGAIWLMPLWPVTINTISLFGFIMVLGIVVDDAIIIGESVYTKIRSDGHTLDNVILGAKRVAVPATFGVLTTIAAFAPMLFVGPPGGVFLEAMAFVVVACLVFSLIESKLILPAHLVHAKIAPIDEDDLFHPQRKIPVKEWIPRFFLKIQRHVQHGLMAVIHRYYKPLLEKAIDNRGVTVSLFLAVLILTFGMIGSGMTRLVFFPDVPQDFVQVTLDMQAGTSPEARDAAISRIEQSLLAMNDEYNAAHPGEPPLITHLGVFTRGETGGQMYAEFPRDTGRPMTSNMVVNDWRDRVGEIPGVKELTFSNAGHIGGGPPVAFRFSGDNYAALEAAAKELESHLATYEGVYDINNSYASGSEEIKLAIRPEAEALGLTMQSLGQQVRQAFYGEEAQRLQRGKDELKVMVRYPPEERRSVADLENMRIRTPSGVEVPFGEVADVEFGQSYSTIRRLNRSRTITVSAELDKERAEPGEVISDVNDNFIPALMAKYPDVEFGLEGSSLETGKMIRNLMLAGVAALFLIYALIAIPLHSYAQPLIIMSVIPFGIIGAVVGHIIMGMAISMFSIFGLIALAGVVVNDSLIMVDFINKARLDGMPAREAVIQSGTQRFRAIMLTSFTTAAGLVPIMLETAAQARFVVPTAVSISYGIVFATVITLFLIPALYMLQLDFFRRSRYLWDLLLGRPESTDTRPEAS
jgi:multidrug efflux pump subunit AcrB